MDVPTPARIDASLATVRRQFDARARRFQAHDAVVREAAARMFARLAMIRHDATVVLDLGCGLGACRALLEQRFPPARWLGVDLSLDMLLRGSRPRSWPERLSRLLRPGGMRRICASAECLPLATGSVDLVFSNLMLHWHPAPHEVVGEIARVLRPGGLVLFSSYGPDTCRELRAACAASLRAARPLPGVDMHDWGDMLLAAGFDTPVMEVEHLDLTYANARALVTEVRALGGNPRADRAAGLPSGARARALMARLQALADAHGRIPLHFEIVIGHGWKAPPHPTRLQTVALPRTRKES